MLDVDLLTEQVEVYEPEKDIVLGVHSDGDRVYAVRYTYPVARFPFCW